MVVGKQKSYNLLMLPWMDQLTAFGINFVFIF